MMKYQTYAIHKVHVRELTKKVCTDLHLFFIVFMFKYHSLICLNSKAGLPRKLTDLMDIFLCKIFL